MENLQELLEQSLAEMPPLVVISCFPVVGSETVMEIMQDLSKKISEESEIIFDDEVAKRKRIAALREFVNNQDEAMLLEYVSSEKNRKEAHQKAVEIFQVISSNPLEFGNFTVTDHRSTNFKLKSLRKALKLSNGQFEKLINNLRMFGYVKLSENSSETANLIFSDEQILTDKAEAIGKAVKFVLDTFDQSLKICFNNVSKELAEEFVKEWIELLDDIKNNTLERFEGLKKLDAEQKGVKHDAEPFNDSRKTST
jgi:predicted nucleic acid-binding protein